MITSLKDSDGKIVAYCEWRLVGPSGYEVPNGEYVYVSDLWVHKMFRFSDRIGRIIDEILRQSPTARFCYFQRLKHNHKLRMYSREFWERRRRQYENLTLKAG